MLSKINFRKENRTLVLLFTFLFVIGLLLVPATFVSAATTVGNAVSVGSTLAVTGATTLNGTVTIGDATDDTLTVTARLNADLDPSTHNARDFGNYDLAYNDVFASGTMYADTFYGGTLTATSTVAFNGNTTIGDATDDTLTVTARLNAALNPNANNTIDLGSYGLAYRNVYASSSMFMASSTITHMNTSTIFLQSLSSNKGGQIVLKAYNGTCYAVYIGLFNDGALGVTSTALAACY